MKELSLHILDIVQNSISANGKEIIIKINENYKHDILEFTVSDNGIGMKEELLKNVSDPFYTSRKTRKVGMGIPLLKAAAEQCDGRIEIYSNYMEGTTIKAIFKCSHIDRVPLGDIAGTLISLIISNPTVEFIFEHRVNDNCFEFSTAKVKEILEDVSIDNHEVISWLKEYLNDRIMILYGGV